MGIQETVTWYQKKIGTYDKQEWEKTIEQRILHGLTHIPMKTAKLKTDFIDVDLVRGSSFPKAKSKHGIVTVARYATARLLLLPLFSKWWVQQTSPRVFALLLVLYVLQLFNIAVYVCNSWKIADNSSDHVGSSEIIVPIVMMWILTLIHSQIVSTNPGPEYLLPGNGDSKPRRSNKVRRRRHHASSSGVRQRNVAADKSSPESAVSVEGKGGASVARRASTELRRRRRITIVWDIKQTKKGLSNTSTPGDGGSPVRENCAAATTSSSNLAGPSSGLAPKTRRSHHRVTVRDALLQAAEAPAARRHNAAAAEQQDEDEEDETVPLDDDGFESLNGNVSSDNAEEASSPEGAGRGPPKSNAAGSSGAATASSSVAAAAAATAKSEDASDEASEANNNTETEADAVKANASTGTEIPPEVRCNAWVQDIVQKRGILLNTRRQSSSPAFHHFSAGELESDSDTDTHVTVKSSTPLLKHPSRATSQKKLATLPSTCSDDGNDEEEEEGEEEEDCETVSSPETLGSSCPLHTTTNSATEWIGVTTNSEDCSYSSDLESQPDRSIPEMVDFSPTAILNSSCAASDKVSCTIWERGDIKKADLTVLDISSAIIARVEAMPETMDYFYSGFLFATILSLLPTLCRVATSISESTTDIPQTVVEISEVFFDNISEYLVAFINAAFGPTIWERTVTMVALAQRWVLSFMFFFLLAVAERTFKQRFLYAKLFSHLTSSRRARKSDVPHFRLNKVRNIKTWLSVRSYLKKRGPQRSVDVIVSAAFITTLLLLSVISMELLKDSIALHSQYNLEAVIWCLGLGIFLLRFMTLGTKINRKYRNLSVLITEQINLYLQIEQKPHKKDELMVANSVLKLAADLLKELESPFKISGLSANPYLYTITKVVILSALSGVLSEMLGFKLKLHKIKIK